MRQGALVLVFALAGCSGPTGLLSDTNISGRIDPPPANYKQLVADHMLGKDERAMISAPQPGTPWSITGGYDHAELSDIDADADTFKIGVRYSFGGDLKARDRSGADLGLGSNVLLGAL